jgi:hypothetical protein
MQEDLDADYKLIRDIDASETETWNEITSDEFTYDSLNFDTIHLNLVASEGTINVVDSTGTDVAFTSNTNNDSITIDDTAIDTSQDLTISYDLATPFNQGFDPVGIYDFEQANSDFTGSFDGQNHTISNLSINRLDDNDVGLFGHIGSSAEVENIGILYADINSYKSFVGSLAGINSGNISNSYSTGNVSGEGRYVGGLVGKNYNGNISNSYSTGNVTGEEVYVGGLVGSNSNKGTVSNSYSTGNVTGGEFDSVGGLIGHNNRGTVSNSYSTGNVSSEFYEVGGLVGSNSNNGTVSNSYSTGNVTGAYDVGGLVGKNYNGNISNSYSTGNVTGEKFVGVLVGINYKGNISNSYSTGNVTGEKKVGGLVGYTYKGNISNSYSTGNVTGEKKVGGLIGNNSNNGTVSNSYWNSDSTITEGSTDVSTDNTKSGVPLTTSQMQGSSASTEMIGFDFTDTWSIVEEDYPELQVSQSKQMQTLFVLSYYILCVTMVFILLVLLVLVYIFALNSNFEKD